MAEEVNSSKASRLSTSSPTPGIRRAQTVGVGGDDTAQFRPRSAHKFSTGSNADSPSIGIRRRSSNFSDYSLNEARRQFQSSTDDLLLPKPGTGRDESFPASHWHSAPLAFALLPAVGGMLFKNGSSVVTDIMILGLAAIFLNWSVRLPWDWYHSAQEIRKQEEYNGDTIIDDDSYDEEPIETSQVLDDVPEDEPISKQQNAPKIRRLPAHEAASNELYFHELLALLSCFLFPVIGAWLLHTIRSSLSRPSEGLVSNYNLTIFLLASELRPMSHLVKLIQARTLHLQRIVNANPYDSVAGEPTGDLQELKKRLEDLESRGIAEPSPPEAPSEGAISGKQTAALTSAVRRTLQPELDSLNRAVRRYEKRLATQTMQTESRILDLEARLADAITLAAAAAQHGQRANHGFVAILVEWAAAAVVLPLQAFGSLLALPFRTITAFLDWAKRKILRSPSSEKARKAPTSKLGFNSRFGADRLQTKGGRR